MSPLLAAVLALAAQAPAPGPEPEPDDFVARARAAALPYVEGQLVQSVSIGVIDPSGAVYTLGVGQLSAAEPREPDERTLYEIGSVTKVLTATLLADAVARGELALEDEVATLLPEDVHLSAWRDEPIRLVHLVTHSSGLPRMPPSFDLEDAAASWSAFGERELWATLAAFEPRRRPGRRYEYSNLGVGLLGHLVARRAGLPYEELLATRLCEPLELADTTTAPDAEQRGRLAPGYDAALDPAAAWEMAALVACGGVRSTAADLLRFLNANLDADPDAPLAEVLAATRVVQAEFRVHRLKVASGWHVAGDGQTLQHSGQTAGHHSYVALDPGRKVGVVVLANTATARIDELGDRLFNLALGVTVPAPAIPVPLDLPPEHLAALAGTYRAPAAGFTLFVEQRGRKLYATVDGEGQGTFRLLPRSETGFAYVEIEAGVEFELDEAGRASGLVFRQGAIEHRCARDGS